MNFKLFHQLSPLEPIQHVNWKILLKPKINIKYFLFNQMNTHEHWNIIITHEVLFLLYLVPIEYSIHRMNYLNFMKNTNQKCSVVHENVR
jgi:hypothetical protein